MRRERIGALVTGASLTLAAAFLLSTTLSGAAPGSVAAVSPPAPRPNVHLAASHPTARFQLRIAGSLQVHFPTLLRVTVIDARKHHPVAAALVRLNGSKVGLHRLTHRTNSQGVTVFRVSPRRVGTVTIRAWKGTYHSAVRTLRALLDLQPGFPIRAAFYYGWFPRAWTQGGLSPYTNYHPSLGLYDSHNTALAQRHIAAMQYGGIQAGIASWWGQGTYTDTTFPVLLRAAAGTPFHWAIYYEPEGQGNPSVAQIHTDLLYIQSHYAANPAYLRVNGRFVVFVYADPSDRCDMATRWQQANTGIDAYVSLKIFPGYSACGAQPDSWHQYSPSLAERPVPGYSFTISPGFWKAGQSAPTLSRDPARWNRSIRDMIASHAPWQLITTFNEWGEGTAIESAQEWAGSSPYGLYLDALHQGGMGPAPGGTVTVPTVTPSPTPTMAPVPTPYTGPDPVLMAAGDIACDPASSNFNGGNGTKNDCHMKATSDLLLANHPSAVLALGDDAYEVGALAAYQQSYDPTWGRLKDITHPAPGNHEYLTAGASGYFTYFGSAAGDPTKGYYSFDLGTWHIIAINSNCSKVGGCGLGSPQERWLKADLAAHPAACTLAYWHHPRFSSGEHGDNVFMGPIWDDLYAAHATIVLNGHDHDYERFAPQAPDGNADPQNGIREFVVGTGGRNHYTFTTIQPNSEVRNGDTFGVLRLVLAPHGYDWQFLPEPGKTFTDSGSGTCH